MINFLGNVIKVIFIFMGIGLVLHYWAFAIAWGVRKGMYFGNLCVSCFEDIVKYANQKPSNPVQ